MSIVNKILREPLFHFLVCGFMVFLAYGLVAGSGTNNDMVVITREMQQKTGKRFEAQWGRQPTKEEWDELLKQMIREEIYYRRAVDLGLDKNDEIIRRRLYQKIEFLYDDIIEASPPTKDQLSLYYQQHPERYSRPFPEIEKRVLADLQYEQKKRVSDSLYNTMLSQYTINIEP